MIRFPNHLNVQVCDCIEGDFIIYARYFIVVHVMFEDGFQMLLYVFLAASQAQDAFSISVSLGVLQCVLFFFFKMTEVFKIKQAFGAEML